MADKVLFEIPLTKWRATDVIGVGQVRREGGKAYKWLKNAYTSDTKAGGVYFFGTDTAQTEVYRLNQSGKGTSKALMAGIAMSTIPTTEYGWFQVQGVNTAIQAAAGSSTAITVGMSLGGTNDEDWLTHGAASGTAPLYAGGVVSLKAMSNPTSMTDHEGYIRCL